MRINDFSVRGILHFIPLFVNARQRLKNSIPQRPDVIQPFGLVVEEGYAQHGIGNFSRISGKGVKYKMSNMIADLVRPKFIFAGLRFMQYPREYHSPRVTNSY